jgi:hypothetical protein
MRLVVCGEKESQVRNLSLELACVRRDMLPRAGLGQPDTAELRLLCDFRSGFARCRSGANFPLQLVCLASVALGFDPARTLTCIAGQVLTGSLYGTSNGREFLNSGVCGPAHASVEVCIHDTHCKATAFA